MQCPLFSDMQADEVEASLSNISYKMVHFPANEIYVVAGEPCKYADIIIDGEIIARMEGESGKQVQIDRLPPSTLLAPAFIFAPKNAMPVTAETSKPTTILRMMPSELKRLIDTDEQIRMNFIRQLSAIDVFLTGKLRMLSLYTVRKKVAHFLFNTAVQQKTRTITLDKTRQEIADMFGIQKFSLLRTLSEFEEKGAIKVEGKQITIINSDLMK